VQDSSNDLRQLGSGKRATKHVNKFGCNASFFVNKHISIN
jgi:hypothetical protein